MNDFLPFILTHPHNLIPANEHSQVRDLLLLPLNLKVSDPERKAGNYDR